MIDLAGLTIDHALGAGGQGSVHLAFAASGTRLAVKLLEVAPDFDRALFERRLASVVADSPNAPVLPVLSHGVVGETPGGFRRQLPRATPATRFVVMHFVDGLPLHELASMRSVEVVAVLATVAKRLARLPRGVAHGDLKAPNIFVQHSGDIVLTDPDLFREPTLEEDLLALGAMGRTLLAKAEPGNELAMGKLNRLLDELTGGTLPELSETGRRFAEIAISLGAPADDLTSVLAGRVPLVPVVPRERPVKAKKKPTKNALMWRIVVAGAVVAGIVAGFVLKGDRPDSPAQMRPSAPARDPIAAQGLYDTTGKVSYGGEVHELATGEQLQMGDGFVGFDMVEGVPRLAILSRDKEILWERLKPPAGRYIHVDVPPAVYIVQIDRLRPTGGIQHDRSGELLIDEDNPQRFTVMNVTMSAP